MVPKRWHHNRGSLRHEEIHQDHHQTYGRWLMAFALYERSSGLILGLRPASESRRYFVKASLIGWAQSLESALIMFCGQLLNFQMTIVCVHALYFAEARFYPYFSAVLCFTATNHLRSSIHYFEDDCYFFKHRENNFLILRYGAFMYKHIVQHIRCDRTRIYKLHALIFTVAVANYHDTRTSIQIYHNLAVPSNENFISIHFDLLIREHLICQIIFLELGCVMWNICFSNTVLLSWPITINNRIKCLLCYFPGY